MSDQADYDLSGQWSGVYSYPSEVPPNLFEATIRDLGGTIAGEIVEPDVLAKGQILHSLIEGARSGSRIRFTKMCVDLGLGWDPVEYDGTITAGGDEIEGSWTIPGSWSGTFLLIRGARASGSVARRVTERIDP